LTNALLLIACLVPLRAEAFSRIIVTTSHPGAVTLDGVRQNSISGRTVIYPVQAGRHVLAVLGTDQKVLHKEALEIPDGVQVRVTWAQGSPFVVSGALSVGNGEAKDSYQHDTPTGVKREGGLIAPSPGGGTNSRGHLGPASGPRPSDLVAPRTSNNTPPPTNARDATVQALRSMTYGAQAGTSFGKGGRTFNQKIKKPNVVYGSALFIKTGGPACRIYDDGMLVAELDAGEASVEVRLEAGRRPLQFRGQADHAMWHQGDLKVDATHKVQLVFDINTPPKPRARPWLWQGM
jgi:hypothetical protein